MYRYEEFAEYVGSVEGRKAAAELRRKMLPVLDAAGAISCAALLRLCGSGDSFEMLATIDSLVECGDLHLVYGGPKSNVLTQRWIYEKGGAS